jgi:hypothetical protein
VTRVGISHRIRSFARRIAACVRADARLTLRLFAWRIALPLLKRVVPVSPLARLMWMAPAVGGGAHTRLERIALLTQMVNTGGWVLVSPNCLERSLMLYRLLSEADANPTLVIGARPDGAALAAHAWIEMDGAALWEADVNRYSRIVAFGAGGRPIRPLPVESPA